MAVLLAERLVPGWAEGWYTVLRRGMLSQAGGECEQYSCDFKK